MYGYDPTYEIGDHVRIARTNGEAELPDEDCCYAGEFDESFLGKELVITEEHEYDREDNSWNFCREFKVDEGWVHEGALEYVTPLTPEDEAAAIASILRAGQS